MPLSVLNTLPPVSSTFRRRFRRLLIAAITLFTLTTFAIPTALLLPPVRKYIRELIEQNLSTALGASVRVTRLRPSLDGRLVIEGLTVRALSGSDSLVVDRLAIRVRVPPLLKRTVSIPSVSVSGLRCLISRGAGGAVGLFRMEPSDTNAPKGRWSVVFRTAELSDGSVLFDDSLNNMQYSAEGLSADIRAPAADSFDIILHCRPARIYGTGGFDGSYTADAVVSVSPRAAQIRDIHIRSASVITRGSASLAFESPGQSSASLTVTAPWNAVRSLDSSMYVLDTTGAVSIDATISASAWDTISWSARVRASGMALRDLAIDSVDATAQGSWPGNVSADIALQTSGGSLRSTVGLEADTSGKLSRYDISVSTDEFDSRPLFPADSTHRIVPVQVSGALSFSGSSSDATPQSGAVNVSVWSPDNSAGVAPATIAARLANGKWGVSIVQNGGTAEGSGTVSRSGVIKGTAILAYDRIGELGGYLTASEPVDGTVKARASFGFAADKANQFTLSAEGRISDARWRDIAIRSASGRVGFDGAEVTFDAFDIDGTVILETLPQAVRPEGIRGTIDISARINGALSSLSADGSVRSDSLRIENIEQVISASGSVRVRPDSITVSNVRAGTGSLWVDGSCVFALDSSRWIRLNSTIRESGGRPGRVAAYGSVNTEQLSLTVDVDSLPFDAIEAWLADSSFPDGNFSVRGTVSGAVSNPILQLSLASAIVLPNGPSLAFRGPMTLRDSLFEANVAVSVRGDDGKASIEAAVPLRPGHGWDIDSGATKPGRVTWRAEGFTFAALSPWIPPSIRTEGMLNSNGSLTIDTRGWLANANASVSAGFLEVSREKTFVIQPVSATIVAEGPVTRPRIAFICTTGAATVRPADTLLQWVIVSGTYEDGVLHFDDFTANTSAGTFNMNGAVAAGYNAASGNHEATIVIQKFPLSIISALAGESVPFSGGVADGKIVVRFRNGRWQPVGLLEIRDLSIAIPDARPQPDPASLSIRLSADSLILDDLRFGWGRGTVSARAVLFPAPYAPGGEAMPVSATILCNGAGFSWGPEFKVAIDSAQIGITGRKNAYEINGDIRLGRSSYERPFGLADLASFIRNSSVAPSGAEFDSLLNSFKLDIHAETSDPLSVDVGVARARARAEITIRGTAAAPAISGSATMVDGTIRYMDRRFAIVRGNFVQSNFVALNPQIDIEAKTELSPSAGLKSATDYTVTMIVSGTMEEPVVTLSCEPPLSQVDIISLLTLGRVRDSDDAALALETSSDLTTVIADRARVIASQQITGYATRRIERLLNLDEVSIDGNLFGVTGSHGPRLTVTKQFRDRLSITYQSVIGSNTPETQKLKVSFKIAKYLFLEGDTDARDNAGIDLRTKWSF